MGTEQDAMLTLKSGVIVSFSNQTVFPVAQSIAPVRKRTGQLRKVSQSNATCRCGIV